tara:strand:+ start:1458 stop:1937 length:480 start_codon:yes stop_codon:yes gene_type:complete
MRRLFMEPIGIFILAMVCQFYSCAQNVSDSVEQMQYASIAGEEYLEGEKIDTNLNDKVYFDFDKSILDAEDKNLLEQYLPLIKRAKVVRLEGHCDERGTREYNLALGERRALEVRDFLIVKGVSGKKIRVVSFGEEKPVRNASNEKAWSENRRVEISLY